MRFLKSIGEYKKITEILDPKRNLRPIAKWSMVFSRICYAFYWALDHITALQWSGFLKLSSETAKKWTWLRISIWFLGIFSSFLFNVINLRYSYIKEFDLRRGVVGKMTPQALLELLHKFSAERKFIYLNIFRNFGDLMLATAEVRLDVVILKTRFSKGIDAIFGLLSSAIAIWQTYHREIEGTVRTKIFTEIEPSESGQ